MPSRIRSSRIRSGNFGAFMNKSSTCMNGQSCSLGRINCNSTSNFKSGSVRVNREYIPSTYETDVSVSLDFDLHYTIHNANHLSTTKISNDDIHNGDMKKPIICIHGGPGIPSDYLKPLAKSSIFQNRAVILYDQIGCGSSSEPSDPNAYSIEYAVKDLTVLIRHLRMNHGLQDFHLFGHSYGGIVAYEYFKMIMRPTRSGGGARTCTRSNDNDNDHDGKNQNPNNLLSITLSSSPFDIREVDKDSTNKIQALTIAASMTSRTSARSADSALQLEAQGEPKINTSTDPKTQAQQSFQQTFVCRTTSLPLELQEAYAKRGKVWGADSHEIQSYVASHVHAHAHIHAHDMQEGYEDEKENHQIVNMNTSDTDNPKPSILLMRGEFDFVSPMQAVENWEKMFKSMHSYGTCTSTCSADKIHTATVMGAGHYGMLDSSSKYHAALDIFLSKADNNANVKNVNLNGNGNGNETETSPMLRSQ